jgi:hypothetical protein
MTDFTEFHAWLSTSSAAPASPAPAGTAAPTPVAKPDHVGEYIVRRNAAAAAKPNPLRSEAENAAARAAGPPPTPIGDYLADYQARAAWLRRRNPDPYGPRRP